MCLFVSDDFYSWSLYLDLPVVLNIEYHDSFMSCDSQISKTEDIWVAVSSKANNRTSEYSTFACSYEFVELTNQE